MQSNDQSVLASEEYVHVWNESVVSNEHESKDEKRGVLQDYVDEDSPNVDGTADLFGLFQTTWFGILLFNSSMYIYHSFIPILIIWAFYIVMDKSNRNVKYIIVIHSKILFVKVRGKCNKNRWLNSWKYKSWFPLFYTSMYATLNCSYNLYCTLWSLPYY